MDYESRVGNSYQMVMAVGPAVVLLFLCSCYFLLIPFLNKGVSLVSWQPA